VSSSAPRIMHILLWALNNGNPCGLLHLYCRKQKSGSSVVRLRDSKMIQNIHFYSTFLSTQGLS